MLRELLELYDIGCLNGRFCRVRRTKTGGTAPPGSGALYGGAADFVGAFVGAEHGDGNGGFGEVGYVAIEVDVYFTMETDMSVEGGVCGVIAVVDIEGSGAFGDGHTGDVAGVTAVHDIDEFFGEFVDLRELVGELAVDDFGACIDDHVVIFVELSEHDFFELGVDGDIAGEDGYFSACAVRRV